MKVYSSFSDKWRDSSIVSAADKLVKLRNTKGMWEVIDEIIKTWYQFHPKEWKSFLINLSEIKGTRENKFASTKDKSLRYILDMPEKVTYMIRKLYTPEECPMDEKWMLKFARRYKKFVVAEKL